MAQVMQITTALSLKDQKIESKTPCSRTVGVSCSELPQLLALWVASPSLSTAIGCCHYGLPLSSSYHYRDFPCHLLFACTGMLAPQANATKTVNLEGVEDLEVWEFKIDLRVVALKGSVPNQWVEDFKQV